jgi:hypothetical protein
MIVSLLGTTTPEVLAFWASVDLDLLGEPVSWAGPAPAPVWLDCARDFTEYWIHQEQIRDATGRHDVDAPDEVHAVLDTFLRAVPYTLEGCPRPAGTSVAVQVDGPEGGRWSWRRGGDGWCPAQSEPGRGTVVRFDAADTVWRLGTRMLSPAEAGERAEVTGDDELARQVLQIVCIIR